MEHQNKTYKNYLKRGVTEEELSNDILSTLDFSKLMMVLKRSAIWIVLFFALSVSGAYLFLRYTPPVYESSSVVKVKQENEARQINFAGSRNVGGEESNDLSGEVELIKSKIIYDQVIDQLNLWVTYHAAGRVMDEERFMQEAYKVHDYNIINPVLYNRNVHLQMNGGNRIEVYYELGDEVVRKTFTPGERVEMPDISFSLNINEPEKLRENNLYFTIHSKDNLYGYISRNLGVTPNDRSQTITISFKDNNRMKAQAVVNKVDSTYLVLTLEDKKKKNEQSIKYIDSQLEKTGEDLKRYEILRESFSQKNNTADINMEFRRLVDELHAVQNQLAQDRIYFDVVENIIRLFEEDSIAKGIPLLVYVDEPKISEMSQELTQAYNEFELLKRARSDESPIIKLKKDKLNKKKDEALSMLYDLRNSVQQFIVERELIEKRMWTKIQSLPPKVTMQSQLIRQSNLYGDFYNMLQEKKLEYEIAQAGIVQEFKILSPASLPSTPISPNRVMIYIYGVVIALTFSLIMLVVRYLLHNTLITEEDFRRLTHAPILGSVPKYKRKMDVSQLVVHLNPKSSISEAFRSLRTNLEFLSSSNKEKKIFSVTSTISGEGKTFISANLSAIIALSGKKVVLLDLDMRKPKVHLAFGAENVKGMSTLLIGKTNVQDAIQKTEVNELDFISAGPIPPNPSELILRSAFDNLLKELHEIYDIIMIDTPPTGLVTDGVLIMKKVDVPLYVARSEYTKQGFEKNLNNLGSLPEFRNLALVINGASTKGKYGYGYGYGYGNYYEEEEKEPFFKRIFGKA